MKRPAPVETVQDEVIAVAPGLGDIYESMRLNRASGRSASRRVYTEDPVVVTGVPWDVDDEIRALCANIKVNIAKVRRNPQAIQILAHLYQERVLPNTSFGENPSWGDAVGMALLSAAQLCDVDVYAVRLRDEGVALVNQLRGIGTS